jgi:uncharacterized membrane protein YdbT with pleckstrin-like domain
MGFSEKLLMTDEKIVHQTKLRWQFAFSKSCGGFVMGCILAFGAGLSTLGGFLMLYGIVAFPFELISYLTSYFVITDRRVLVRTGFVKRRSLELLLSKVEAVAYEDGLLERINGAGHIAIVGTGGTKELLPYLENPLEFKRILQEKIHQVQKAS